MSKTLYDALERAVKALKNHTDLPPTISVSMTEDGLWVTPWLMGAPMQALLAWHNKLRDVDREFEAADGYCKVTVRGFLEDVPVIAQAVTFQEVTGRSGRLSEAELRRLAGREQSYETETIDEPPEPQPEDPTAAAVPAGRRPRPNRRGSG